MEHEIRKSSLCITKFQIIEAGKLQELTINVNPDEKVTLITADGGVGKSTILAAIRESIECSFGDILNITTRTAGTKTEFVDENGDVCYTLESNEKSVKLRDKNGLGTVLKGDIRKTLNTILIEPDEFCRKDFKEQQKFLKEKVGIDVTSIEQDRSAKYKERTKVNSEIDTLTKLSQNSKYKDCVINIDEINKSIEEKKIEKDRYTELTSELNECNGKHEDNLREIKYCDEAISDRERQIENLQKQIDGLKSQIDGYMVKSKKFKDLNGINEKNIDGIIKKLAGVNIAEIDSHIETLNVQKSEYQLYEAYKKQLDDIEALKEESSELTKKIQDLDNKKVEVFKNVGFSDGITFSDEFGFMYNGVPIAKISHTEKIKFAISLQKVINKDSRLKLLLIDDVESGGTDAISLIKELIEKENYQVFAAIMKRGVTTLEFTTGKTIELNESKEIDVIK